MRFTEFLKEEQEMMSGQEAIDFLKPYVPESQFELSIDHNGGIVVNPKSPATGFRIEPHYVSNGKLLVRFSRIHFGVVVPYAELDTLQGFPSTISGSVDIEGTNIKSLDGLKSLNMIRGSYLRVATFADHFSLTGVGDHLEAVSFLRINNSWKEGGLGMLKIRSLEKISNVSPKVDPKVVEACAIFTKHLKGDKDIVACKRELISAGLKEYAKL